MIKPQLIVEEIPSTGYGWEIVERVNCNVNTYINHIVETRNGKFVAGGSHPKVFELEPIEKGEYRLVVVYRRSWETDASADHSLSLEGSW